jgi:hypothetical protein
MQWYKESILNDMRLLCMVVVEEPNRIVAHKHQEAMLRVK